MTKRITGRHAAIALVAFFGVVIAVNVTMAMFATRTFGGVVVENSYVASQKFNQWLSAAERQKRLGWSIEPALDSGRKVVVRLNVEEAAVRGFARHPLGREPDVALSFAPRNGEYVSDKPLPSGRWDVHLLVKRGVDEARLIEVLQ